MNDACNRWLMVSTHCVKLAIVVVKLLGGGGRGRGWGQQHFSAFYSASLSLSLSLFSSWSVRCVACLLRYLYARPERGCNDRVCFRTWGQPHTHTHTIKVKAFGTWPHRLHEDGQSLCLCEFSVKIFHDESTDLLLGLGKSSVSPINPPISFDWLLMA